MAECDIFREQLGLAFPAYGHALWNPRPWKPNTTVEVGDVGFIRMGKFHRLFNALCPRDRQPDDVPDDFEQLVLNSNHISSGSLNRSHYYSARVAMEPVLPMHSLGPDYSQATFKCLGRRGGGAALSLPVDARSEDTLARDQFKKWILKHIDSLFAFAQQCGLGIERMDEIILVTGFHRTQSWMNVAFFENRDARVSFATRLVNTGIDFQISPEDVQGAVINMGPQGKDLPEDQCIFVRGYRVARTFWSLRKDLKAAAGPSQDQDSYDYGAGNEVISIPATTKYRDPLDVLVDYISEQAPDCDMVLVHDEDLKRICHGTSPKTLQPDVLMDVLRRSDVEIHKVYSDLSAASGNHTSETNVARIAMFSSISKKEGQLTIGMLPDDVLLNIFDQCRLATPDTSIFKPWGWHRLAHVCNRWRDVIFNSPRRLELRLVYTYNKPAQKNVDFWPALPLYIWYPQSLQHHNLCPTDEDNVIAALKHPGRICKFLLTPTPLLLGRLIPLMQDPFPMLEDIDLRLAAHHTHQLVLPSTFLGESTPQLRSIILAGTPFPTLPHLLLTAPALVSLRLYEIPIKGYFSPEALVTGLDAKPKLEVLEIMWFASCPGQKSPRSPYPQTRVALPALTEFQFRGDNEYLEDLIARIDTPSVEQFSVALFDHSTLDIPQLAEFIKRTEVLTSSPHRTSLQLWRSGFVIDHYSGLPFPNRTFRLHISYDKSAGKMKRLVHVCRQLSPLLSNVGHLEIEGNEALSGWYSDEELNAAGSWLELFSLFGAVRMLRLIRTAAPFAASALGQSIDMGYMAVLPSLQDLRTRSTDRYPQLESFLAARRRSGRVLSSRYEISEGDLESDEGMTLEA